MISYPKYLYNKNKKLVQLLSSYGSKGEGGGLWRRTEGEKKCGVGNIIMYEKGVMEA